MIKLVINNNPVQANSGDSLLEAATKAGIHIPAMCTNGELEHFTSCMLCVVKDVNSGKLIPACSAKVAGDMNIVTGDEEVIEARKTALELLLSDHSGDCEAPCRIACPAFMDIPLMNRLIAAGKFDDALDVVSRDIAMPAVLGRICPAPCEKTCKRKSIDQPVAVCLLKRFAADHAQHWPKADAIRKTDKKVAVIGAGPAGLSAAKFLQSAGVQADVYDNNPLSGGAVRYAIGDDVLDKKVLDNEIEQIVATGVNIFSEKTIDKPAFEKLRQDYNSVVIATGNFTEAIADWGLDNNGKQLTVEKSTYRTSLDGVFAIGNVRRSSKLAIRSAAQGKEVALVIAQVLNGETARGLVKRFNSATGKLRPEEFPEYLRESNRLPRQETEMETREGFSPQQARIEATRCLRCDCRKANNCLLRDYSHLYRVSKNRFSYTPRKAVIKNMQHDKVVYEPGKCIKCGICVRLTSRYHENAGVTFIGRGFDVKIDVPFNKGLNVALEQTFEMVCEGCPTGALALK